MNNLKDLRKRKGLNQTGLALQLNISQSFISSLERGLKTADQTLLIDLANFFNCSIDYLLGRTNVQSLADNILPDNYTIDEIKLLENYRNLSRLDRMQASNYINYLSKQHAENEDTKK